METKNLAKACWAGGAVQIYLNVPAADYAATQAAVIAAFEGVTDPNDWTGDGAPEGWTVIDRVFTKAEARYIPNGPNSTSDMAHPTRTGDVVAFSYPPYQFDAATPGTLIARSAFFGQHGYVPDVVDRPDNINMRATFLASGPGIRNTTASVASIDMAPTVAFLLRIPVPQHSQGRVVTEILRGSGSLRQVGIIGINDFHGQLDPTTRAYDNAINATVGGAAFLATWFDEEDARITGRALLLAAGDNVGASPPNSGLLNDRPAIQVENAWGMDATSYGNHEFDYGIERLRNHQRRADFPFLAVNIVDEDTGRPPSWVRGTATFTVNGVKVGVIGAALEDTPELVSAGATEGLEFLPAAPAIEAASRKLERQGVDVQVVVIHEGTAAGSNAVDGIAPVPWTGPIMDIAAQLTDTTIDAIQAGHTHRVSNTYVGDILITEGINAGASYSVINLMVSGGDVIWAGGSTRVAKTIGMTPRADVQKIVDRANEKTAVLRNQVIGEQLNDILRDPERFSESEMGNLVADAMLAKYPGIDAALTNSGGLRADLVCTPPSAEEGDCEITWGEVFAVLPFGNRTVIADYTGAQLKAAGGFINGFLPVCDGVTHSGRFPQVAGMVVEYHCASGVPVIEGIWLGEPGGTLDEVLDTETVRLVTNDFMFTGGDGWTALTGGTNVLTPGDGLLEITIEYITANSPVDPVVEGRIVNNTGGG
jgi:2',3'-cyclic-nucleotide 2'-phosphodiesterase (5'-nucleotidase family)